MEVFKVNLELEFRKMNQNEVYWKKDSSLLLAISGGVDSMVMLDLFERLSVVERPKITVAHVNHQLREASISEANYLRAYCQTRGIPYFETEWAEGETIQADVENQARQFRYQFFGELMTKYGFDALLTAHHQDDQAETVLMKLVKGSQLQNLVGIREESVKNNQKIIRPFLSFSKEAIVLTAKKNQVVYFNDETNQEQTYFRNRMRQQVIPQLKNENPQFLNQLSHFTQQIDYANEIIAEKIALVFPEIVTMNKTETEWILDLPKFWLENEGTQFMLLTELFQRSLVVKGVGVSHAQQAEVLKILKGAAPQKQIHLQKEWRFERSYESGRLWVDTQKGMQLDSDQKEQYEIRPEQALFLSDSEWLACYAVQGNQDSKIPVELKDWQKTEMTIGENHGFPLLIRKRQAGDSFVFNKSGQTKQVKRYFIDQKISAQKRLESWIVTNQTKEILWIMPEKKSYLSIPKETDKIHYRLIYLKK